MTAPMFIVIAGGLAAVSVASIAFAQLVYSFCAGNPDETGEDLL